MMLLCQQGLFGDMEVVLSYVSGFFPMHSWCDKLSQVSAWHPQRLLITAGLVYWVLKTEETAWSLVSSLRSPQRAPHTDLALPAGLTLWPPLPCPQLSRPGARVHPRLLPLQLIRHAQSHAESYRSCLPRALESFHICHCHLPYSGPHQRLPGLQQ